MSEDVQNTPETPKPNTEIDLGELFRMIGRGFNSFFIFLRNTFLFLLDLAIRALLIVRVHIVKFVIVGFLSIVIGWFIDARKEDIYISSMYIEANYGSTRQLYSNIGYYNALTQEADCTALSKIFGIDKVLAGSLRGFFIEPDVTENALLNAYSKFMKQTDTTYVQHEIDFKKFKLNTSPVDFNTHRISVFSSTKEVIPILQPAITTKNIENKHVKKQKDVRLKSLEEEEILLKKQLIRVDTLSEVYRDLLRKDSEETRERGSGTYFQMAANDENKTNELEMLALNETINKKILEINLQRELNNETINVLSDFSQGGRFKDFYDNYLFKIPIITLSLLFLWILLRELNSYLNRYLENKKLNA